MKVNQINYILKIKKSSTCFFENHDLTDNVSFKTPAVAKYYCEPKNSRALAQIVKLCKENDLKYFVLGNGTNTLFYKFDGLVICTKQLREITVMESGEIICQSGVGLFRLNMFACQCSLSGLEWSYGIPGSVGGAVRMNAGAYGHEIGELIEKVEVFDGRRFKTLGKDKLWFKYRSSFLSEHDDWIVTKVYFKLKKLKSNKSIKDAMFANFEKRKKSHPLNHPSAGSVFKRQEGVIPAKIIDDIGLKGAKVGGAEVSEKHAGFIVNKGNATAQDVEDLINHVQLTVKEKKGIDLEREVVIVRE